MSNRRGRGRRKPIDLGKLASRQHGCIAAPGAAPPSNTPLAPVLTVGSPWEVFGGRRSRRWGCWRLARFLGARCGRLPPRNGPLIPGAGRDLAVGAQGSGSEPPPSLAGPELLSSDLHGVLPKLAAEPTEKHELSKLTNCDPRAKQEAPDPRLLAATPAVSCSTPALTVTGPAPASTRARWGCSRRAGGSAGRGGESGALRAPPNGLPHALRAAWAASQGGWKPHRARLLCLLGAARPPNEK